MKNALLLLILTLITFHADARSFKLLSWNTYMLPKPIKFSLQHERSQMMVRELQQMDSDVIGLQEAFWGKFRGDVRSALKSTYPYSYHLPRLHNSSKVMSSGLLVLSRRPFDVLGTRYFTSCAGADCYAAKGVVLMRFHWQEQPIHIAFTHMQAGEGEVVERIRAKQLGIIRELMSQFAEKGIPQMVMGDLNIDALTGGEASRSLKFLEMSSTPLSGKIGSSLSTLTSCFGVDDNQSPKLIDHFWMRQNSSGIVVARNELFTIRDNFRGRLCDLSDHLPLTVSLDR